MLAVCRAIVAMGVPGEARWQPSGAHLDAHGRLDARDGPGVVPAASVALRRTITRVKCGCARPRVGVCEHGRCFGEPEGPGCHVLHYDKMATRGLTGIREQRSTLNKRTTCTTTPLAQ